eukprot:364497-Chlamydomonas_euryale.AAC.1
MAQHRVGRGGQAMILAGLAIGATATRKVPNNSSESQGRSDFNTVQRWIRASACWRVRLRS